MNCKLAISSLFFGLLLAGGAQASGYLPVADVPGAVQFSTAPIGISDNGVIAGSYQTSDGNLHGFFGPINGSYRTFDAGPNGTQARAINNGGYITGFSNLDNGCSQSQAGPNGCVEFEVFPNGAIVPVTKNGGQLYGIVQGINSSGVFVGNYAAAPGVVNGFYGYQGVYSSDVTLPIPVAQTRPRAINNKGTVVGFFLDANFMTWGFVLKNGVITVIAYPNRGQTGTQLEGVNDQGVMSGLWSDSSGNEHSFVLSADLTTFTDITPPGSTYVQSWNINNAGEVAVSSDVGAFIYCSKNGNGHCQNNKANALVATDHTFDVRPGTFRSFVCANGCRSSALAARLGAKPLFRAAKFAEPRRHPYRVEP